MARATLADDGAAGRVLFHCPGCGDNHQIDLARWGWNGSVDSPTFVGSVLVTGPVRGYEPGICHSFVSDGRIQYLTDSTHVLAGQTVDLPDWPPVYTSRSRGDWNGRDPIRLPKGGV